MISNKNAILFLVVVAFGTADGRLLGAGNLCSESIGDITSCVARNCPETTKAGGVACPADGMDADTCAEVQTMCDGYADCCGACGEEIKNLLNQCTPGDKGGTCELVTCGTAAEAEPEPGAPGVEIVPMPGVEIVPLPEDEAPVAVVCSPGTISAIQAAVPELELVSCDCTDDGGVKCEGDVPGVEIVPLPGVEIVPLPEDEAPVAVVCSPGTISAIQAAVPELELVSCDCTDDGGVKCEGDVPGVEIVPMPGVEIVPLPEDEAPVAVVCSPGTISAIQAAVPELELVSCDCTDDGGVKCEGDVPGVEIVPLPGVEIVPLPEDEAPVAVVCSPDTISAIQAAVPELELVSCDCPDDGGVECKSDAGAEAEAEAEAGEPDAEMGDGEMGDEHEGGDVGDSELGTEDDGGELGKPEAEAEPEMKACVNEYPFWVSCVSANVRDGCLSNCNVDAPNTCADLMANEGCCPDCSDQFQYVVDCSSCDAAEAEMEPDFGNDISEECATCLVDPMANCEEICVPAAEAEPDETEGSLCSESISLITKCVARECPETTKAGGVACPADGMDADTCDDVQNMCNAYAECCGACGVEIAGLLNQCTPGQGGTCNVNSCGGSEAEQEPGTPDLEDPTDPANIIQPAAVLTSIIAVVAAMVNGI